METANLPATRKKAGKFTISLTGTLPHKSEKSLKKPVIGILPDAHAVPSEAITKMLSGHLHSIEEWIGDWKRLFDISAHLISVINDEAANEDGKQAARLALQSEALQAFFQKFSATNYSRYYPQVSPSGGAAKSASLVDLLAIPFDDRRDSFPMKEEESRMLPRWVYDNRQKLRDAFMSLLQESLPGAKWTERALMAKAKEGLFSKALYANGAWLAELFLGQFQKWYIAPRVANASPTRMEMLEQRMQPKPSMPSPEQCYEFFSTLVRSSDSLGMILALGRLLPEKICELEEQCCSGALRRNEMFKSAFLLIPGLVKLNTLVCELLQQGSEGFLQEVILRAKRKLCLFLHLKWAHAEYRAEFEKGAFGTLQSGVLRIAGLNVSREGEGNALLVDLDPNLDVSFVLEEAFPELHAKLSLQQFTSAAPLLPAPRKIQPVLSPASPSRTSPSALPEVQQELRKWFWWQHPQEHELVKSIVAYASSTNAGGSSVEQSLQALLAESVEPPELAQMMVKLALEKLPPA